MTFKHYSFEVTQEESVHFIGLSSGQVTKFGQSSEEALHTPEPHLYGKLFGQPTIF
jgi:hypothetical protein